MQYIWPILYLISLKLGSTHLFNLEIRLPIIKLGNEGSYFGYSIAAHQSIKENERIGWLLVGAPLDQNLQPKTKKSGALWKCPISTNTSDCIQVPTDGRRKKDPLTLLPPGNDEVKDNQWLGVTVKSQGPGGKVMVCAHRYISKGEEYQWGRGLCYTLKQLLEYDGILDPCKGKSTDLRHEGFGYCQAGTSGLLLEDDSAVIGTPSLLTWRGTIFLFNISDNYLLRDKTVYYGAGSDAESPVEKYSYLGMSTTAGHFYSSDLMSYASGAPRGNGTGQVVIFTKMRASANPLHVNAIIKGDQFASSFGYEIAAADLNGDGLSDLIVGAPFYFQGDTGGAIYIYINKNGCLCRSPYCHTPVKITGKSESRFGFAITNLGDLNKDGFEDIAVGAPYEGNGVVYIYLGSKKGLITEPSQIIKAESISKNIPFKTFGYSLSGKLDLDENGYPDMLVGAYEQDAVVLIRSRPIIDLKTWVGPEEYLRKIDPSTPGCNRNNTSPYTCFSFDTCCSIDSVVDTLSEHKLTLRYTMEAETFDSSHRLSRIWFGTHHTNTSHIVQKTVTINQKDKNRKICQTHVAYLKSNIQDKQSPIKMKISYQIIDHDFPIVKAGDPVPSLEKYPILNQQHTEKIFQADFQKDCGDNDICESELVLAADLNIPYEKPNDNYILSLGENEEILLNITLRNLGESAYETNLYVSYPDGVQYSGIIARNKQTVFEDRNNTIKYPIGNPFGNQESTSVKFRFDASKIPDLVLDVEFTVFVNSTSVERAPQKPIILHAKVVKKVEFLIVGMARPSLIFYGGQLKGESAFKYKDEVGSRVLHTYSIYNAAPSPLSFLDVHIEWPLQVASNEEEGKWLLYLDEMPYVEGGGECKLEDKYVNPVNLVDRPGNTSDSLLENVRHEQDYLLIPKKSKEEEQNHNFTDVRKLQNRIRRLAERVQLAETYIEDGKVHKTVKMNCLLGTAKCVSIICTIYSLPSKQHATISIRARLWNATLLEDYSNVDDVKIFSRAKIRIPSFSVVQPNSINEAVAETIAKVDLMNHLRAEPPLFILIASTLAGLLVFILLTLLLWKLGFFKRRRPDPTLSGNLEKHRLNDVYDDY